MRTGFIVQWKRQVLKLSFELLNKVKDLNSLLKLAIVQHAIKSFILVEIDLKEDMGTLIFHG